MIWRTDRSEESFDKASVYWAHSRFFELSNLSSFQSSWQGASKEVFRILACQTFAPVGQADGAHVVNSGSMSCWVESDMEW